MRKDYSELTFADDFMFCKILSTNLDLTKELLEMILNIRIREIKLPEPQKTIEITPDGRGIRLDVYVESSDISNDCKNNVYDIEMQTRILNDLPKRSRYYQGMIDLNLIERNSDFRDLKKSYIIFICTKDPFNRGRHIYTFENRCVQDTNHRLGDDAYKVFLNSEGTIDDVSRELGDFLKYLSSGIANSDFTKRLDAQVESAKMKDRWRIEYMTFYTKELDWFYEGKDEGKAEGKASTLFSLVQDGDLSVEKAAKKLEVPVQEFEKRMTEAGYKIPTNA